MKLRRIENAKNDGGPKEGDKNDDEAQDRDTPGVARSALGAAQGGEGADAEKRRAGATAPGTAVGSDRQGVSVRNRRRQCLACGPFPRPLATPRLPFHVRAGLRRRLSVLLGDRGRLRRVRRASGEPRRDAVGGVTGPA